LFGVHPQLDLKSYPPAHRFRLLGHIDHAAAAFADALEDFVAADLLADNFVGKVSDWELKGL
jgi:hypothetical protein